MRPQQDSPFASRRGMVLLLVQGLSGEKRPALTVLDGMHSLASLALARLLGFRLLAAECSETRLPSASGVVIALCIDHAELLIGLHEMHLLFRGLDARDQDPESLQRDLSLVLVSCHSLLQLARRAQVLDDHVALPAQIRGLGVDALGVLGCVALDVGVAALALVGVLLIAMLHPPLPTLTRCARPW